MKRCDFVNLNNPLYVQYHDNEWGIPQHDDNMLFEMLILECFQAGLSWECVLNKRTALKTAFDGFNIDKIAHYDDKKCQDLMNNSHIIRHKLKIQACIINAQKFKLIQNEFKSFNKYIWHFTDNNIIIEPYTQRTSSPLSDKISKDLKKRGMKFVGSVIIYSYLQAIGIINGHVKECAKYKN